MDGEGETTGIGARMEDCLRKKQSKKRGAENEKGAGLEGVKWWRLRKIFFFADRPESIVYFVYVFESAGSKAAAEQKNIHNARLSREGARDLPTKIAGTRWTHGRTDGGESRADNGPTPTGRAQGLRAELDENGQRSGWGMDGNGVGWDWSGNGRVGRAKEENEEKGRQGVAE